MGRDTLIDAIKDLIETWEEEVEDPARTGTEALTIQCCIDDLKGILPPEE